MSLSSLSPPSSPLPSPPEGFRFKTELRVRYAETDAQTVVYHSNYFIYFEVARVAYDDAVLASRTTAREPGIDVILAHVEADFSSSAHFDDRIEVWARVSRLGRTSYDFLYLVRHADDGVVLCRGKTTQVVIDSHTRRPVALPARFVEGITAFEHL